MRLQQGQLWKTKDSYLRIVHWERLSITYKSLSSPDAGEGPLHDVSKKEFCRLIKHATLIEPEPPATDPVDPTNPVDSRDS